MKTVKVLSLLTLVLTIFSCQNNRDSKNVVSQQYVHKYGFDMSESEWQSRPQDGKVITVLDSGVTVTNTYNNSILHGETTYTFANSGVIEKLYEYDNNTLIREVLYDQNATPYKEKIYEPDNKVLITLWDKSGVPISEEVYESNELISAKYFKPNNEVEASIEESSGTRIKRDRNSEMLYKDEIDNGILKNRTTFHPNGQIKSQMAFKNYTLHGEQNNYSDNGELILNMHWNNGNLEGMKTAYRNNNKIYEIPFASGKKHGIEKHFYEDGRLKAEVHWDNDKKHGSERVYHENDTHIKWYYKGKEVSIKKFDEFSYREKLVANKDQFYEMIDEMDSKNALKE